MNIPAPGWIPPARGGLCVGDLFPLLEVCERDCRRAPGCRPPGADGCEHRRGGSVSAEARDSAESRVPADSPRRVRRSMSRGRCRRRSHGTTASGRTYCSDVRRLEPRDRPVVRPQVQVEPTARRPRRPAAQQVVSERAQGRRLWTTARSSRSWGRVVPGPLRRRQLAALVRHWVLLSGCQARSATPRSRCSPLRNSGSSWPAL